MGAARRGRFVVLEGGDAAGKSTQVDRLAERLRSLGRRVVTTREPGGTPLGEAVRRLFLHGPDGVDPVAEVLLVAADRAQHVAEVVRPALDAGADVVSDRYTPSSLVYQGVARGVGVADVDEVCRWATGGLEPDVVVVLDVPAAVAAGRRGRAADRMEREDGAFHESVRQAYRRLAAERGWVLVDGGRPVDAVADAVWAAVAPLVEGSAR